MKAEDGSDFDASELVWDHDWTWRGNPKNGPRQLTFSGRSIRVFVLASKFGLGGLVEGDHLPSSGRCWVAVCSYDHSDVESWLRRLQPEAIS